MLKSRKRPYPQEEKVEAAAIPPRLSVVEFCAVLNGSSTTANNHDAEDILQTLQKFVSVVRSERRAALHLSKFDDDDEDDEDYEGIDNNDDDTVVDDTPTLENDDEEKVEDIKSTKRFKKEESWKEDTMSYQVPFVGTSHATTSRQQDYGQLVEHTWPCGLLQAYLIKSPMIRELLIFDDHVNNHNFLPRHVLRRIPPKSNPHDHKKSDKHSEKQKNQYLARWQHQLVKVYLQALNQVLTALLVPTPAAQHNQLTNTLSDASQQRLMTLFQNQVLPVVWQILQQQQQQAPSDAASKATSLALVPMAMRILVRVSSISVIVARQVSQHLATHISLQTQSSWFSLPNDTATSNAGSSTKPPKEPTAASSTLTETSDRLEEERDKKEIFHDKDKKKKTTTPDRPIRKSSHATCCWALRLVSTLLEYNDSNILSTIMSTGAKERKLPPGLLYTALRASRLWKRAATNSDAAAHGDALTSSSSLPSGNALSLVERELGRLIRAIRAALEEGMLRRRQRQWMDLWSGGDAWQNLLQLAALTPVTAWTEEDQKELHNDMEVQQQQQKPKSSATTTKSASCISSVEAGRLLAMFLTKVQDSPMLQMLHGDSGTNDDDASLIQAKNNHASQQLVRALMYLLVHKPLFGRLELMPLHALVLRCLQTTPGLAQPFFRALTIPELTKPFALVARWRLILKYLSSCTKLSANGEQQRKTNLTLKWTDKLKHVLSKALQCSNAMVVAETLKLILNLLESYAQTDNTKNKAPAETLSKKDFELNSFFELQVLLSVRSRWNPFQRKKATPDLLIVVHLCQVLDKVAKVWPRLLMAAKYDWVKLLPPSSAAFTRSHPLLQLRLLRTLETLMELQLDHETNAKFTPSSIRIVLEIMIESRSKSPQVSRAAAQVVMLRFRRLFLKNPLHELRDAETLELCACVEYEWECWLGGLTIDALPGFLTVVEQAATKKSSHVIAAALAWEMAGLPGILTNLSVSPILLTALLEQPNPTLALLMCQVATKSLLYHRDPLQLAAIISSKDWDDQFGSHSNELVLLSHCAKSLADVKCLEVSTHSNALKSLALSAFGDVSGYLLPRTENASMEWLQFTDKNEIVVAVRLLVHLLVCARTTAERRSYCKTLQLVILPLLTKGEFCYAKVMPALHFLFVVLSELLECNTCFFDLALLSCPTSSIMEDFLEEHVTSIALGLRPSEDATFLSSEPLRFNFLLNGSWSKLFPPLSASRVNEYLLDILTNRNASPPPAIEKLLLVWVSEQCARASVGLVPLKIAFQVWCNLCDRTTKSDSSWRIARQLELFFGNALEGDNDGVISTQLYTWLERDSFEDTIERCLRSKYACLSDPGNDRGPCMLRLILNLDICSMLPIFIRKVIGASESSALSQLFEVGSLDCALILATDHLELLEERSRADLASRLVSKARTSFARQAVLSRGETNTLTMITKCVENESEPIDMLISFAELVSLLNHRVSIQDEYTRLVILDASNTASRCFSRIQGDDSYENSKRGWFTSALMQLCSDLPKALRSFHRADAEEKRVGSDVVLKSLNLLQFILTSTELSLPVDQETIVCLGIVLKTCLKHGITDQSPEWAITAACLRLARLTLGQMEKIGGLSDAVQVPTISARIVFRMVVTHSKFHVALASKASKDKTASVMMRLELIRLLICCVSMARAEISFDRTLWSTLLSTFDAGVTAFDEAFRRLLSVYSHSLVERAAGSRIMADEMRWSKEAKIGTDGSASGAEASRWEWLLDSIDADRVRKTTQHFPVWDTLYPQPLEEEKVWLSWHKVSTNVDKVTAGLAPSGERRTTYHALDAFDARYSPGFILPMVLSCLESVFPGEQNLKEGRLADVENVESIRQAVETLPDDALLFVTTVKRFCDLGMLSFALAALCSMCPLVRKVSVGILAMFLKALRSEEAAGLQEWRERPQLLMLVNSVRRSLVIRNAAQKIEGSFDGCTVRRLPSVSAIFLSRAATVLAKPGDAMFVPMNKFFLKVELEHGAYQDLTRLPAFVSLFCSSSEEPPGQSQRERTWALRLLEDGFLEDSCYRLVASCHAPALVQTFLATVQPAERDKDGKLNILIVRTLCRFLTDGGPNACTHLIGRMGLLSFLRCLLTEESMISEERAGALFRLIQLSLQGAVDMTNNDVYDSKTLVMEATGLARPTLDLAAKIFDNLRTSAAATEDMANESFIDRTIELLWSLKRALEASHAEDAAALQGGVSLHSASSVLQGTGLRLKALLPLCALPIHVGKSEVDAIEKFCILALSVLHATRASVTSDDVVVVMSRTTSLLQSFDILPHESRPLRMQLIACRSICFRHEKGKRAWLQCMAEVSPGENEPTELAPLDFSKMVYKSKHLNSGI